MHAGKRLLVVILAASCPVVPAAALATQPQANAHDAPLPDGTGAQAPNSDFVSVDDLRQVHAGMDKEQVHSLLGSPHSSESLSGMEQWNYLFGTRHDNGEEYIACQYRVRYDMPDAGYRVESVEWDDPDCLAWVDREHGTTGAASRTFSLWSEVLFASAKSGPGDILPGSLEDLGEMVEALRALKIATIRVTGHADQVGSRKDNQALSQRRADTVREFLVGSGIPAKGLSVQGVGETEPVGQCDSAQPPDGVAACLQSNRRVEVLVKGWSDGVVCPNRIRNPTSDRSDALECGWSVPRCPGR